jgi:hypothetical protein
MELQERLNMVAPCGIDCGICELYTCKDDAGLFNKLIEKGFTKDMIPCNGCRSIQGKCPMISGTCSTYTCVTDKKISFCYECEDFPCVNLHPSSDRAQILPHNMKVYNLCTIKRSGLDNFVKISPEIKRRYYQGKMAIGSGPQL